MITPRYQDVALRMVRAKSGASHHIDDDAVLIYPRGEATAVVDIPAYLQGYPLTSHSRSSWARRGLHVTRDQSFPKSPYQMSVLLKNWAYYGLVIRQGDTIILANSAQIKDHLPLVQVIPLHAADKFLWVNIGMFPHVDISDGRMIMWSGLPYLDTAATENYAGYFEECHYSALHLMPGTFFVIAAEEQPDIPNDCFAIVESATKGLLHASAILDKPGSHGKRALEFRALRECCIRPGMHVATLNVYRSPVPLSPHTRVHTSRDSIVPLSMAAR